MLLTICTIQQLPQALTLGDSFSHFAGTETLAPVLIGLVDKSDHLPPNFTSPYPILPVNDLLPAETIATLSAQYTPTEFAAACKPLFIAEAFRRYPETDVVVYADPNIQFLAPLAPLWHQLNTATILLTPFLIRQLPTDRQWPDEKFFQNIGLYSADFIAFRRSSETDRMLAWWDDRVRNRAYINFCDGLCLDQLWLMHVPVFFRGVQVVKNPGWHVALWNLPERPILANRGGWLINGPTAQTQPLLFMNFKGLLNPDEGFFSHQTRLHLSNRPHVTVLYNKYRHAVDQHAFRIGKVSPPAYGQQPEPVVLRGWRHRTYNTMQTVVRFLDRVYLPALR